MNLNYSNNENSDQSSSNTGSKLRRLVSRPSTNSPSDRLNTENQQPLLLRILPEQQNQLSSYTERSQLDDRISAQQYETPKNLRGRAGSNGRNGVETPMSTNGKEQQKRTPQFDEESMGGYIDEDSRRGKRGRNHQRLDDEKYSKNKLLTFEDFDTVQLIEKDEIFQPTTEDYEGQQMSFNQHHAEEAEAVAYGLTLSKLGIGSSYERLHNADSRSQNQVHTASTESIKKDRIIILDNEQHCEIDPDCEQISFNKCSSQPYRGCMKQYCYDHSGSKSLKKNSFCRFKACSKDTHADICSKCSNDIISAQKKFFLMSMLLGALIFIILICLLHLILIAIPSLCQKDSNICQQFHKFWHTFSFYEREGDSIQPSATNQLSSQQQHLKVYQDNDTFSNGTASIFSNTLTPFQTK